MATTDGPPGARERMRLPQAILDLEPAQFRTYMTTIALRVGPTLADELGPAATKLLAATVAAIGDTALTYESFRDILNAFDEASRTDAAGPTMTNRAANWTTMARASHPDHLPPCPPRSVWSTTYTASRGLGETLATQWATYASVIGVPVHLTELWASLAEQWTGTPAELTAATATMAA